MHISPWGQIIWPAGTATVGVESSIVVTKAIRSVSSCGIGEDTCRPAVVVLAVRVPMLGRPAFEEP